MKVKGMTLFSWLIYNKHRRGANARDKQENFISVLIIKTTLILETFRNVWDSPALLCFGWCAYWPNLSGAHLAEKYLIKYGHNLQKL